MQPFSIPTGLDAESDRNRGTPQADRTVSRKHLQGSPGDAIIPFLAEGFGQAPLSAETASGFRTWLCSRSLFTPRSGEMSTRTYMVSLQSLEPIRNAVGSKDLVLLDALLQALSGNEDFRSYARRMIMDSPPAKEPGCWNYLVEPLAEHFGLSPHRLPLDDWKHYYVWEGYRSIADPLLSEPGKKLLEFMESGRPFVGSSIDHDGCAFAWLTAAEAQSLLGELAAIDAATFGDLDEFHEELLQSLQETTARNADLFLGAH